jgi:hypothetical protein
MTQARNLSLFADNVSSSGTVAVAGITATGTPSSSTYLRGDGSWTTVNANPGGSTTQIQFNNAGAFGGSSSFTWDGTTTSAPILKASNGLLVNSQTVGTSYSIPSGYSAQSAGPVSLATGVSVTLPSGSRWVIT